MSIATHGPRFRVLHGLQTRHRLVRRAPSWSAGWRAAATALAALLEIAAILAVAPTGPPLRPVAGRRRPCRAPPPESRQHPRGQQTAQHSAEREADQCEFYSRRTAA